MCFGGRITNDLGIADSGKLCACYSEQSEQTRMMLFQGLSLARRVYRDLCREDSTALKQNPGVPAVARARLLAAGDRPMSLDIEVSELRHDMHIYTGKHLGLALDEDLAPIQILQHFLLCVPSLLHKDLLLVLALDRDFHPLDEIFLNQRADHIFGSLGFVFGGIAAIETFSSASTWVVGFIHVPTGSLAEVRVLELAGYLAFVPLFPLILQPIRHIQLLPPGVRLHHSVNPGFGRLQQPFLV